jgi:integrase
MKLNAIRIVEFTNPSGAEVFRVTGKDKDGKRVRENFKTHAEAQTRKSVLENEIANLPTVRMVPWRWSLTEAQVDDAATAFSKLPAGMSLLKAVMFARENYRSTDKPATVKDAYENFIKAKEAAKKRPATVRNLKNRVGVLAGRYPDKMVSDVLPEILSDLIYRPGKTARTVINDRAAFSSFFSWCVRQRHCQNNPVERIDIPETDETRPEILPLDECRRLVNEAAKFKDGKMLPYVALALFCAIRPAELERLTWDSIDLKKKVVRIDGEEAKMRTLRNVEISGNCLEILRDFADTKPPIVAPNFNKDFRAVRKGAKITTWPEDAMRHTGISYHLERYQHEGRTAQWAGNSPDVVQKKYKALVSKTNMRAFWKIGAKATNIVKLEKAA